MQRAARRADQNVVRRCILMFELSVNLARILEVLATQLPETFLRGSTISLTRLVEVITLPARIMPHPDSKLSIKACFRCCESLLPTWLFASWLSGCCSWQNLLLQVLSFILSHTTDGPGAAVLDAALSTELSPLKAKVSRPLLLAPIVGE